FVLEYAKEIETPSNAHATGSAEPAAPVASAAGRNNHGMVSDLRTLYQYRDLLVLWAMRDIRVRYKQSFLGVAWAIIQPLSVMVIFTVIFSLIARLPSDGAPYPLFSYSALLPWTLLSTALTMAVPSLVNNLSLVTKTYFPREILPIAAVLASLLDFLIAAVVFVAMMLYYHTRVGPVVLLVPVILILQLFLVFGITLWAAALNVFYRDIRFVVPLATQLWMYLTPIIYPLSMVPERFRPLYLLNPMAGFVEAYRRTLVLSQYPDWPYLGLAGLVSVLTFVLGYGFFKRAETHFADLI
ncbi:MAG TPA: ABC transporter permease, partial [Chloroflexota bacterium]|nr:ABC transporter permease [Chloroflexota bacterium]